MSTTRRTHNLPLDRLPETNYFSEPNQEEFLEAERDEANINKDIIESAKANRYIRNTLLRSILGIWAALLVSIWMWKVGEILVNNNERYHLSDNVLNMLLGTTTVQVIGIILIVMKDLFDGKSERIIK